MPTADGAQRTPRAAGPDVALVLFDLDGTLVDTAGEIQDAVNDTLGRAGLGAVTLAQVQRWIGHGTRELLLKALAAATGPSEEAVRASALYRGLLGGFALDYERRCGTRSQPYPGARALLQALGARGVARAVVTNKEERFTAALLQRHRLAGLVDRLVCGDTLATRKPDPEGVRDCLRAFGVPAHRAVFIGDSAIDVATARAAGVPAWAVTYGYNMGAPIAASAPDRLLDSLETLLDEACRP